MNSPARFFDLTAADLMSRDLVLFRDSMPLREVAKELVQRQISGAPVVDAHGKCVGVVSASDFLRLLSDANERQKDQECGTAVTCDFQERLADPGGERIVLCTLPAGACAIQQLETGPDGRQRLVCTQPSTVLVDWQIVELDRLPEREVRHYITADPVTVKAQMPISLLARMMLDAHIHRLIVVDEAAAPVGIVTTTDLVAAIAYGGAARGDAH
jgi:CBS domain-containing protein